MGLIEAGMDEGNSGVRRHGDDAATVVPGEDNNMVFGRKRAHEFTGRMVVHRLDEYVGKEMMNRKDHRLQGQGIADARGGHEEDSL